jgi:ribA/ribD-fused uncharacterized protein
MNKMKGWENVYVNPDEDPETRKRNYMLRLIVNYCRSKQYDAIVKKDNLVIEQETYPDLSKLPPQYTPPNGYKYAQIPGWKPRQPDTRSSSPATRGAARPNGEVVLENAWHMRKQRLLQKETRAGFTFTGEASPLSAIHLQPIKYKGETHKSSEHLYQSLKGKHNGCNQSTLDEISNATTGQHAHDEGKKIQELATWRKEEIPTMTIVQTIKFTENDDNKRDLLATFPQDLIFSCPESFWGGGAPFGDECYERGTIPGRNYLGHILMEIRDDIRHGKL